MTTQSPRAFVVSAPALVVSAPTLVTSPAPRRRGLGLGWEARAWGLSRIASEPVEAIPLSAILSEVPAEVGT